MLNPLKSLTVCSLLILSSTMLPKIANAADISSADDEPISVAAYIDNGLPPLEIQEEIPSDTNDAMEALGLDGSVDNTRISPFNAATANNKILIHVHKSSSPEYLEVMKVNEGQETPMNIFSDGTNRALVSTATPSFHTCGKLKNQSCSTPVGSFRIDSMQVMHHSNKFNDAPMPFALFFAANNGIAIHGAVPSEYKDLGKPASHGCVRVHPKNAQSLFDFVNASGGRNSAVIVVD